MNWVYRLMIPTIIASCLSSGSVRAQQSTTANADMQRKFDQLPLGFEPNHGQHTSSILYEAHGSGYTVSLRARDAVITSAPARTRSAAGDQALIKRQSLAHSQEGVTDDPVTSGAMRFHLLHSADHPKVSPLDELPGKVNYLIGGDAHKWHTGIPTFSKVQYSGVYPGVDLVYYGAQGRLEFDFIVHPGADPGQLEFALTNEASPSQVTKSALHVSPAGSLIVPLSNHKDLELQQPVAYQRLLNGHLELVAAAYQVEEGGQVKIKLSPFDHTLPLVIDPVLSYSTFLAGSGFNQGQYILVDDAGETLVTGSTDASDYPITTDVPPASSQHSKVILTKLNATGSALVFSTIIGGSNGDFGTGLAVGPSGNLFVTGYTSSVDFPVTAGAYQTKLSGDADSFVAKLSSDGSKLLYGTLLGGSGSESSGFTAIAVDASGRVFITGDTTSADFPVTANAPEGTFGNGEVEAYVSKFNAAGSRLLYSTYLGGSNFDEGTGLLVDTAGNAYVTGHTQSPDFPTTAGAFQRTSGASDAAFVTKLNPAGSAFVFSTLIAGNTCNDYAFGGAARVAATFDTSANLWLSGYTTCSDFPVTTHAVQKTFGDGAVDGFVSLLNSSGSALLYSTYLGGSDSDFADDIQLDRFGNVFVQGSTASINFPTTKGSYQRSLAGSTDAFLTKLNACGTLLYSTYLGGTNTEVQNGGALAVDHSGGAYLTGDTYSSDFPTTRGAFERRFLGSTDAFVTKIDLGIGPPNQASQCSNDNWKIYTSPRVFTSEDDCDSFVQTAQKKCTK